MTYDEIYSQFYTKIDDPTFFQKYNEEEAYELMGFWLHSVVGLPYVRKCFSSITLDDDILEINFQLCNSTDEDFDNDFVKDILAQGLAICWMQQKIDRNTAHATVVSGKEERTILNNYKNNMVRLNELKTQFRKIIRDHGYINNSYIGGE